MPVVEQIAVAVPPGDGNTLAAVHETVRPEERETIEFRLTVPVNPLMLVRVTVNVSEEPWTRGSELGLTNMLKSPTLTVNTVVWVSEPLVAVTVNV